MAASTSSVRYKENDFALGSTSRQRRADGGASDGIQADSEERAREAASRMLGDGDVQAGTGPGRAGGSNGRGGARVTTRSQAASRGHRKRSSSIVHVEKIEASHEELLDQSAGFNYNADWVNYKGGCERGCLWLLET